MNCNKGLSMIDLRNAIGLHEASKHTGSFRGGKPTCTATMTRWILRGVVAPDGTRVRLDAVRLGGKWLTSLDALQRFAERQTPAIDGDSLVANRTPTRRSKAASR